MSNSNKYIPKLETDLITLRSLVAIADEGSFSAAAKRIGRTQSAVSLQISKLEDRIGAKLFERTSRKVSLTDVGEKLVSYVERILDLADEAMVSISAPDVHEVLRIGFSDYLVPKHLHPLLARFRRAHPKVELRLNLGIGSVLYQELEKGNLDIVIACPEAKGGQVLYKEPLVWVGPKGYVPADTVSLILMPAPCRYRKAAFDTLAADNHKYEVTMEANSIHGVLSAVEAGLGISVIAKSAVTDSVQVLDHIYGPLPNTTVISYLNPDAPQVLAESFITFFMEGLSTHNIGMLIQN